MDENLYKQWKDLYDEAFVYTKQLQVSNGILIEVAAQHPLVDRKYPNTEFTQKTCHGGRKVHHMDTPRIQSRHLCAR